MHAAQAVVEGVLEPEEAMRAAGVYFTEGALAWLTPSQKAVLVAELEAMEVWFSPLRPDETEV